MSWYSKLTGVDRQVRRLHGLGKDEQLERSFQAFGAIEAKALRKKQRRGMLTNTSVSQHVFSVGFTSTGDLVIGAMTQVRYPLRYHRSAPPAMEFHGPNPDLKHAGLRKGEVAEVVWIEADDSWGDLVLSIDPAGADALRSWAGVGASGPRPDVV